MAKQNFKPQRPARKAKLKADPQKRQKVNKKATKKQTIKKQLRSKACSPDAQQSLRTNYFDNLPTTHNAFIGELPGDTLNNVVAGIDIFKELVLMDKQGLMLNSKTCVGLFRLATNLIQALEFERCQERL